MHICIKIMMENNESGVQDLERRRVFGFQTLEFTIDVDTQIVGAFGSIF